MTVRYECNPPKIGDGSNVEEAVARTLGRLLDLRGRCDAIHITENVLGHERVSPIVVGRLLMERAPQIPITASLRVRDKTEAEIERFVNDCIDSGFSGVLTLMGDPQRSSKPDTGQYPSATVKRFKEIGLDSKIDLYLSVPNDPNEQQLQKKIEVGPKGFFTQVVQDLGQVQRLADRLSEFNIIPIILHPSEKNKRSAEFLGLDMNSYASEFDEFVRDVHRVTGDILITSPSDFAGLCALLDSLGLSGKGGQDDLMP